MDETKEPNQKPNPMKNANWVSKLLFCWLNPLFREGNKRRLEADDMYGVLHEDTSEFLSQKLQKQWDVELERKKSGHTPSLRNAMIRTFGKMYMFLGLIAFLEETTKVVQPLLMGGLIRYFSPETEISLTEAYLYALGVGLCAIVIAITHHPYFFLVQRVGMWLRVASCSLIYKKALRLSNAALGETTTGQIVNLMSNDVVRFDQTVIFLHFLWIGPLQAIFVLIILYYQLGPASLAGFAILLLLIPVQGFMGRLFSKLRRKTAEQTDERVRIMNEILTGMRVIKMYCWENMFGELVNKVRSLEISRIINCSYARASTHAPFFASAKIIAYLTFLVYMQNGKILTAELVFVAMGLFNPVRLTLTLFVPFAVTSGSEAKITLNRIERFLLLEELEENSSIVRPSERPKPSDCKVTAMNVTALWDKKLKNNTLEHINFEVRAGELLAVIGPVGAGKSSLLMGLLGELPLATGSIKMSGTVAYASQQPWVFSASVKQNILFGQPFDSSRYHKAITASALAKDIEIMPDGDGTLVGERGVSLSGGQKARISLARALYFDADIYLLDDPLSAVDPAVGRHIFDKCIRGMLKDKPCILVTHQLQYLQEASKILILKEGNVMGLGTFEELAEDGVDFAALLKREDSEEALSATSLTSDPIAMANSHHGDVCANRQTDHLKADLPYLSQSLDRRYLSQVSLGSEVNDVQQSLLSRSVEPDSMYLKANDVRNRQTGRIRTVSQGSEAKNAKIKLCHNRLTDIQSMESLAAGSMVSLDSINSDIKPEYVAPRQAEEERAAGTVSSRIYVKYFYRGAGVLGLILFIILNLLAQGTYILADWWLSYWATQEENRQNQLEKHEQLLDLGYNQTNVTIPDVPSHQNLYIYTGITLAVFLFGLIRALHIFHILVTAAKHLHNQMFSSIVRCPVLFFDTNPVGRILNRFSKDMGAVDETLPLCMYDFIQCALMILGIVLVAGVINPWVFIPTVPLGVLFVFLRRYYLNTSRDIKRLEATTRSPVFSLVSASLQGLQTVRAYHVQEDFMQRFDNHQDGHTEAWFLFLTTSRWLAVRLDWLCAMFITAVALCSVMAASSLSGGVVGLSLTYAIGLMGLFQWGVRQSAEVENQMTSVERIMEYAALTSEAPLESVPDKKPPADWPQYGIVSAEGASLRYTTDGEDVLKNVKFSIRTKEKVGIVGRTGAGKSSLIAMLFRLAEPSGKLLIDGLDITELGLHDLRAKISIIPQDPMLFNGTIRKNLDPFHEHDDAALWRALEEVQLKPTVMILPETMEFCISEGGINFSVGQRQLICLARAVLKQNRILIIDEATANVDPRTDSLIQQTIREKFRECSVLTIAHRLNTIMDSDRVMVLQEGYIKEFDEPYTLLQDDSSLFHEMVSQVGPAEFNQLLDIAKDAYFGKDASYDKLSDHVAGGGECQKSPDSTSVTDQYMDSKDAGSSPDPDSPPNIPGSPATADSLNGSEENVQFPLLHKEGSDNMKV